MNNIYMGIDVGGTNIKFGKFNANGDILNKWEITTRIVNNGEFILPDICDQIFTHIDYGDKLKGVGIGVPGPVTKSGVVLGCVNLGWPIYNIEENLSNLLGGIKVKACNDATVAALGECYKGAGINCTDMVLVTLGTGVGSGIIVDGKLMLGYNGAAGEIGHMPVKCDETEYCTCGKKGCLEQVASATGLVREAQRIMKSTDISTTLRSINSFSAKDILDLAKLDDKVAMDVIELTMGYLGIALASVACVINPKQILIGGGLSKAGTFLLNIIEEQFKQYVFKPCGDIEFKLATLGNDAGIFGAAALIINS